ncbi:MAG: type IV pilus assembly protein PilM [Bacteriovoracaceae bacterium]|nr:type IV pilus assembly protein PilM [Bacteriovoracaceae bacterium]
MSGNSFFQKLFSPLQGLLSVGQKTIVGVDIGTSAIKVCELAVSKDKLKLLSFSSIPLSQGCILEDEIQKHEEVVSALKKALSSAGVRSKHCAVGVFGPNTIAKRLQVEAGTPEEIENQVMWESEHYIPFEALDSAVSHHVIGKNEGGGNDVILAAARQDVINAFRELVTEAGLKVAIVDLSLFALNNIFEYTIQKNRDAYDDGTVVIDFGAQTTKLIVYKNKAPIFTRELSMGGAMITEEIQRQMGISFAEAEDLKTVGDASGNLPEEVMQIIETSLETFFAELRKTLVFFLAAATDDKIHHCFITGGSAQIPGFAQGLETLLEIKVNRMSPMDSVDYSRSKFSKEAVSFINNQGAVVLGLAMRQT